jgi:uncharacterized protein YbjT (DUF2867 family)
VARVLIVGCGCRGQALARELAAAGHVVRGTTRSEAGCAAIAAAGAEPYVGDPDRVGTLSAALDAVTVACWLLGSAHGEPDAVAALHGPRLRAFCERLVDTTVRGFVYEVAGTAAPAALRAGEAIVREASETWEIPLRIVDAHPSDHPAWLTSARAATTSLLERC